MTTINKYIAGLSAVVALAAATAASPGYANDEPRPAEARLITLGTGGGPIIRRDRAQASSLLLIDGHAYLVDCGEGAVRRLAEAGIQPYRIEKVFLTHLHMDHVSDLGQLIAYNWQFADRRKIPVFGPPGIEEMLPAMVSAFAIPEKLFDGSMPPHPTMLSLADYRPIAVPEGTKPTLVYEDERVKVFAVRNSHYSAVDAGKPSYGAPASYSYRFETKSRSFVFTGDTGPSAAVVELARNADVLVSEVVDLDKIGRFAKDRYKVPDAALGPMTAHMVMEHLEPRAVGQLAASAGVKLVVLSHIVPGLDSEEDPDSYAVGARQAYKGAIVIARDLDNF